MAWNQADPASQEAGKKAGAGRRTAPSWVRGAVAALVVVVLGGGALLLLTDSGKDAPRKEVAKKSSVSVKKDGAFKAATATSNDIAKTTAQAPAPVNAREAFVALTNQPGPVVRGKGFRLVKNTKKKLFHTVADAYISRVINTRPGHAVIGTINYDHFQEQFKKALETPITIDPSDTEEEAAIKSAVIETRKELKAAMDRGEDIGQIMRESEEELRKLWRFRSSMSQDLAAAMRERKFSAKDMQDYVDAANKMLKDNGMEPLKHPQFWVRQLELEEAESTKR